MLLFQKLITETQMSKPPGPAMDHNSIKINDTLHSHLLYVMRHPVTLAQGPFTKPKNKKWKHCYQILKL